MMGEGGRGHSNYEFKQVCFEKSAYTLPVFFNRVPYMQVNPLNTCKLDWEENLFWYLCRINSFQNQNTYRYTFNLIINDTRLYNSDIRTGTNLDQTQAIKQ